MQGITLPPPTRGLCRVQGVDAALLTGAVSLPGALLAMLVPPLCTQVQASDSVLGPRAPALSGLPITIFSGCTEFHFVEVSHLFN